MSTFTVISTVTHRSLMNKSKDDLARWVLHLLDCRDEDERRRVQRVTDLLEANNSYQQLARDAREALKRRFDLAAHLERQRAFNGARGCGWHTNPWVAAYTFRPILGNIDRCVEA